MHFHEWLSLPCYGNYFIIRPSLQGTGWFAPTNRDQVPLVDNAGWKDEARAYIGYPMSRSNRTAENRRRRRRRGDRILASEEATGGTLISGRFGRTGNWNKETLGRSIHKLVGAAPLAADRGGGGIRASLWAFVSAHGWKSQLKCMRQVLSDVGLPRFYSPPSPPDHVPTLVLALFPRWHC